MSRLTRSPSSDSGIHSLGEQWEDTSVFTTNTEEGDATLGTLIDCVLKHESDESSDIDMRDNDRDSQGNENVEFYSDQELTTDESPYDEYEPWSNDLQHTSIMRDPVDPPGMSHLHRQNSVQQCEDGSSVWTETDGGNSDICNLADFSSEEEDISDERNSGCQGENIIGIKTCAYTEDSEWEDAGDRAYRKMVENYNFDLVDGMTPMVYVPMP